MTDNECLINAVHNTDLRLSFWFVMKVDMRLGECLMIIIYERQAVLYVVGTVLLGFFTN